MGYKLGVDVGGTFTDVCLFNENTGSVNVYKVSSTPKDPSVAIAQGLIGILEENSVAAKDVVYLVHGTTVATNAALEHKGAVTGLVTTQGFKDLLELARQKRPDLYDLMANKPQLLIPRHLRKEVRERLKYDGSVLIALDAESVKKAITELKAHGVESIAVSLLHSYVNPIHEKMIKNIILSEFPNAYVSISYEVLPEFREYERLTTTVLNAYLGPKVSQYMQNLEQRVHQIGIQVAPYINQSNGGVMSIEGACNNPVKTALSGPSAGVVGATYLSALAGFGDIITFDMGGTSTDVCLIEKSQPHISTDKNVAGYPVKVPMTDVNAVGAGGGSIAWVDSGGGLKVGPRSAGAEPGPASYGKGGVEPTVTDANIILGRLNQESILGGKMKVDLSAAREAINNKVAGHLDMSEIEAAKSILWVVISNMVRAIRVVSVERGYDPRSFVLVAFGGAGPLHAAEVAKELGMKTILIPENPGILCAMGLLVSDIRADYVRTRIIYNTQSNLNAIQTIFADLEKEAKGWLSQEGVPEKQQILQRFVDMRYEGQNYELAITAPPKIEAENDLKIIDSQFHFEHEKTYGYKNEQAPTQLVNFRVTAVGGVLKAKVKKDFLVSEDSGKAKTSARSIFFNEFPDMVVTPVYQRSLLKSGHVVDGPAVVEQMDSTVIIPPNYTGTVDCYRNIIIREKAGDC